MATSSEVHFPSSAKRWANISYSLECSFINLYSLCNFFVTSNILGTSSNLYLASANTVNKNSNSVGAVTGSRLFKGSASVKKGNMPFYKMIGNIFLKKFFNFLFKTNFTDAHSGLWAYNLNFLKNGKFKNLADNFNFDQDFRFLCMLNKMNIKEIFIKTKYGDERSQLHVIYALRFLYNSIKFFLFNKNIK